MRALVAALAAAAAAAVQAADSWSALVEPRFEWQNQTTTDQAGATTRTDGYTFGQTYNLALAKSIYPNAGLSAGGTFDDARSWLTTNGVTSRSDAWQSNGYAQFTLGSPVLNAGGGYTRSDDASRTFGSPSAPRNVDEIWTAQLAWNPADLPSAFVQYTRTHLYDALRTTTDQTTDDVLLTSRYRGVPDLDLEYSLRDTNQMDQLSQTDTNMVTQALHATWNGKLLQGRTVAYVAANAAQRVTSTTSLGAGGLVLTQQFPIAGYSLVEAFPATPALDTLVLNPSLVNGNLSTSGNIDIGYGVPAGDIEYRDLGVQFQDVVTKVNRVWVWVDKRLPPQVAAAYTWAAYQGDDNVHWTPIPLVGPAAFGDFQNRFEIPIADTQARFVKVVVQPLAPGVTVDPAFAAVHVTEVQVFLSVPAAQAVGRSAIDTESVSVTAQTRLLSAPNLSWDTTTYVARTSVVDRLTYSIQNGLSLSHVFSPVWSTSARVQRQDEDSGAGHVGGFMWNAAVTARPLPTLMHGLVYSGTWSQTPRGVAVANSLNAVNRAELYRGASAQVMGTVSDATSDVGQRATSANVNASLSAMPNSVVSSSAGLLYGETRTSTPGAPAALLTDERLFASLSLAPVQAVFLSGNVTRVIKGAYPTTMAGATAALSPFPGGDLQFRVTYSDAVDTGAEARVRTLVPGIHWLVRQGVILDASYSWIDNRAAAVRSRTNAVLAILTIVI